MLPFNGTFRMPFAIDTHGRHVRSDRKHAAFYLADDLRTPILVRPTELSVGFPTVRLEVTFGQYARLVERARQQPLELKGGSAGVGGVLGRDASGCCGTRHF